MRVYAFDYVTSMPFFGRVIMEEYWNCIRLIPAGLNTRKRSARLGIEPQKGPRLAKYIDCYTPRSNC